MDIAIRLFALLAHLLGRLERIVKGVPLVNMLQKTGVEAMFAKLAQ